MSKPMWLPEVRQFSQAQPNIVQRPEGLEGGADDDGLTMRDINDPGQPDIRRYAEMQVSPGRFWDTFAYTVSPMSNAGGEIVLVEVDLDFSANSWLVDNWTNQWLYEAGTRRRVPPYSGGWVLSSPKGFQKARILLQAPSAAYAPAATIGGEFAWFGFHEAYLPPQQGIIDRTKTPVVT